MSGNNIVSLHGALSAHETGGTPHELTIERLEGLLERARKGEIQGIAYSLISHVGDTSTGWTCRNNHDAIKCLGAARLLEVDMANNILKTGERT